jgi:hypothetical protein
MYFDVPCRGTEMKFCRVNVEIRRYFFDKNETYFFQRNSIKVNVIY